MINSFDNWRWLLVVGLVAATVTVGPVQPVYVTSDSMEPALSTGDLAVVVDIGEPSVGDVILFRQPDGERITHRVVGVEDGEYITQGDANPSTDQAAGAPPVPPRRVGGALLTVAGVPVAVPAIGGAAAWLGRNPAAVVGVLAGLVAFSLLGSEEAVDRRHRDTSRDVSYLGGTAAATAGLFALVAVGILTFGGATTPVEFVGGGEEAARTYGITANALPGTTHATTVSGEIAATGGGGADASEVTVSPTLAPDPVVRGAIHQHVYVRSLPASWLVSLQRIHPVVAATASIGTVYAGLVLAVVALGGLRRPLRSAPNRGES